MSKPVPTALAAAIGLVPTVLGGVRRLPGRVVQLPVLAVSSALTTLDATRRGYDDLAARGERLLANLRGKGFDEFEDRVEDALQGTPLAAPYDTVEDALEDAGERAGRTLRAVKDTVTPSSTPTRAVQRAADKAAQRSGTTTSGSAGKSPLGEGVEKAAEAAQETVQQAAGTAKKAAKSTAKAAGAAPAKATRAAERATDPVGGDDVPEAEQPKGEPTPKATQPDDTRIGTAAAPEVVSTVEAVSARTGGTVLDHDELPLADYDHMTLGSLRGRLRSLDVEQLVQIRDYEKAHADRLPVVTMLDNRIAKLTTDASAEPTGKTEAPVPEKMASQTGRGGSKVTPATGGPAQNPPSQGVPTNPAQPRTTGSPGTNPNSEA